jgi:hypothetical protein
MNFSFRRKQAEKEDAGSSREDVHSLRFGSEAAGYGQRPF